MSLATSSTWSCTAILRPCCRRILASRRAASSYARPLPEGALPVYDEALSLIRNDQERSKNKMQKLRKDLAQTNNEGTKAWLKERIDALELRSELYDPEVRWRAKNGQGDMSKSVFRYIAEEAWRTEGRLGILMQRIEQMNIISDLLGVIDPDADLQVSIDGGDVIPGAYLLPSQTVTPPNLRVQVYHPEERLYTILMVDPDSPNAKEDTYKTALHWAVYNVPLSSTQSTISTDSGEVLQSYIPPHPERGTPYHRYTYILYEQSSSLSNKPDLANVEVKGLNTREFAKQNGLSPVGVHFFRQEWDKSVSKICTDVLKRPEVVYGKPPKASKQHRR